MALPAPPPRPRPPFLALAALAACLGAGVLFRFAWPDLIEYKYDEAWTAAKTREMVDHGTFPRLGMPNSREVRNPGLGAWAFAPLGVVFGADPVGLARGVAVGSVLALGGLLLFARRCVPAGEREPWAWAVAVAAVNPVVVLFHRKVWPPCVTPPLCVLALLGWWYRDRRWGGALWGFVTALIGQIHAAGFLVGAGLGLWALLFDRRRTAWVAAVVGGAVGSLPMVPWVEYLATTPDHAKGRAFQVRRLLGPKFWPYWVTEPVGLGAEYHLGPDMPAYLRGPEVGGRPTHLVAAAYVVAIAGAAGAAGVAARAAWRDRAGWGAWLRGRGSPTDFTVRAGFLGFGLVTTVSLLAFHRHYLIAAFPLPYLWLARLALPAGATAGGRRAGRACLAAAVAAQAVLTGTLLLYLHAHGGGPVDGFGKSYGRQVADDDVCPVPVW